MSNFKKFIAGVSTVAMAVSSLALFAPVVDAATAGGVYKTSDGTVWFVTKDMQRRPFTSGGAFSSYGFLSFSQVVDADSSVTALPSGSFIAPQDGRIFCATATKGSDVAGECALITGGKKAAFTSSSVFGGQGYSFSRAFYGDSSFLEKTSNIDNASAQHRPGALINNNGTVQLVVSGGLWGVPSMDVFNSWGWSFADVVPANSADTALSQTGVIPARMAGELVPSATTVTPPASGSCNTGEGSVKQYSVGSADKTSLAEAQSDVELAAFNVKLNDDGCLTMDRFDLYMGEDSTSDTTESDKPWKYFDEVHLLVNGTEVASQSVDSSSDWTEVTGGPLATANQQYRVRFSGLSSVFANNETTTVSVAFDSVSTLDSANEPAVWQIGTQTDSFRFIDGTGFVFTDGSATLDQSFNIDAPDKAALVLAAATDDLKAQVIQVNDTSDTNGVEIGKFNIEETSDVDVNITELTVTLTSNNTITNITRKLYLYDGSTLVGQETVTSGTVTFDGLDLDIDGDTDKDITVKADLDDTDTQVRYQDGDTLQVSAVNLTKYTDAFDNDEGDFTESGSYAGATHALFVNGISLALNGTPTATSVTVDGSNNDRSELVIKFDVTAFGKDAYIQKAKTQTASSTGSTTTAPTTGQGVGYHIQYAGTDPSTTETGATTLTSTAEEKTNSFLVPKGQTKTFTLKVIVTNDGTPDLSGTNVRALLAGVGFADTDSATADFVYTFNLGDYKTDFAVIAD